MQTQQGFQPMLFKVKMNMELNSKKKIRHYEIVFNVKENKHFGVD